MDIVRFLLSFFYPYPITRVHSKINGDIKVVKFFGKNRIIAGNHTQSGEYVEDLLGRALDKIPTKEIHHILLLGLGGGSVIKRINSLYPQANIVGVEIDPAMVDIGKKYLDLERAKNLEVVIEDAFSYVKKAKKNAYDVIIVDLFLGIDFPKQAESDEFLTNLASLLAPHGTIIVNRLYTGQQENEVDAFVNKMKHHFKRVETQKVYSHLLIISTLN